MINITQHKDKIILSITSYFWIILKFLTYKLWLSNRVFPTIPPFDSVPIVPNNLHFFLFIVSVFLIFIISQKPSKILIIIFLFFELTSCSLDQMRWQPWEFQFILIFAAFSTLKKQYFLKITTLILLSSYLFSGLHKINNGFLYSIWNQLILKNFFGYSDDLVANKYLFYLGLLIPIIEILIGFGLYYAKNKSFFLILSISMHAFIILLFSPIFVNHNLVIIPWNLFYILIITLLFFDSPIDLKLTFSNNNKLILFFIIIVFLPILNFFNCYDDYLSSNVYSGNSKTIIVFQINDKYYPELIKHQTKNKNFESKSYGSAIYLDGLALDELNVPIYPETRTFKMLKKQWNLKYTKSKNRFFIYKFPYKKQSEIEI